MPHKVSELFKRMNYRNEILYAFLSFIISTIFIQSYFHYSITEPRATISMLVNFEGYLPFQARILSILIVKYIPIKFFLFIVVVSIVYTFRSLLDIITHTNLFVSLIIFLPLYANYVGISRLNIFYPYDLPAVLLFIIGLRTILKQNMSGFYIIYVLAILNRETGVFLSIGFILILLTKIRPSKMLFHLFTQAILLILIKGILLLIFANNPGGAVEWKFFENIYCLLHPQIYSMLVLISAFGGLWIFSIMMFNKLNGNLKRLVILFLSILASMFVVGNPTELRIYSEAIPVVTIIAIYAFIETKGVYDSICI